VSSDLRLRSSLLLLNILGFCLIVTKTRLLDKEIEQEKIESTLIYSKGILFPERKNNKIHNNES
jgi:hypothetical protein